MQSVSGTFERQRDSRPAFGHDAAAKKAPLRGGASGSSSSVRMTGWFAVSSYGARLSDSNGSAQRSGTSRHHEHLNFPAETFGANTPASIARPACYPRAL